MDSPPPITPAERMSDLQDAINDTQREIDENAQSRENVKENYSLSQKERGLLITALDIQTLKLNRQIAKLQSSLASQRMSFMKETFWRSF